MKTHTKSSFLLFIMLFAAMAAKAQQPVDSLQPGLAIIAQSYGDSIVIRWAPSTYPLWSLANKHGYMLERWAPGDQEFRSIAGPIFPFTLQEWKSSTDTTDANVTAAAQALLGKPSIDPAESDDLGRKLLAHEEQQGKLAFALLAAEFSTAAAKGLGLRYVDRDISDQKHFLYRLFIANADEAGDTVKVFVDVRQKLVRLPVRDVKATGKDKAIEIVWNRAWNDETFSGYFVEKSADGKTFKRLNSRPYISSPSPYDADGNSNIYTDSVADNGITYWYRIIGITSFADEGLPSDAVSAMASDLTAPMPPELVWAKETEDGTVAISWQSNATEKDHAGFYVLKGYDVTGDYKVISGENLLKKSMRTFTDPNPWPHRPNYYKIMAVDDKGNQSKSIAAMALIHDDVPPAKPTGLMGTVDSLGIVSLAWQVGIEKDLKGYRVFMANNPKREFVQITSGPIPGNFYTDTINLKTLTGKVYYKIAAFDYNYNPSDYSEILELQRPDYIPPVQPLMKQAQVVTDTVKLRWVPSSSSDVARHVLLRKKGVGDWELLDMFEDSSHTYNDTDLLYGEQYQYAIEAVDDAGLRSGKSSATTVVFKKASAQPAVSNLVGQFEADKKKLTISWDYNASGKYKFLIMKGEAGKPLSVCATVTGNKREFEDQALYANETGYDYAVKALFSDGRESSLSMPVQIRFNR